MTDIEKKALAFLNDVCAEMGLDKVSSLELDIPGERALLRAIEQHEAFKREVSDAVEKLLAWPSIRSKGIIVDSVARFIIAKPVDPLVEAIRDTGLFTGYAADLRAAIEARGGRIVWEGE